MRLRLLLPVLLLACGTPANVDDPELPPTTHFQDVEAWLAKGYYKAWHCEGGPHDARSPSPHGVNRIWAACTHAVLSGNAAEALLASGIVELVTTDTCPTWCDDVELVSLPQYAAYDYERETA